MKETLSNPFLEKNSNGLGQSGSGSKSSAPEAFHSGVVMGCPLDSDQNKKDEKCNYTSIKITKGDRSYDSKKNKENYFQIVCGNKNTYGVVKVDNQGMVGPPESSAGTCRHKSKVFDLDFKTENRTDSHVEFRAHSFFDKNAEGFTIIKNLLWPPAAKPIEYTVCSNTCGTKKSVQVIAYPDIESTFSLKAKGEGKNGIEFILFGDVPPEEEGKLMKIKNNPSQFFALEFESKYDSEVIYRNKSSTASDEEYNKLPAYKTLKVLFNGLTQMSDVLNPVLSKANSGFTLKAAICPDISISCARTEIPDSVEVDYDFHLEAGFSPLFKLTGEFEFIGPVISKIPGLGTALVALLWLQEKCKAGEVSLKGSISGSVSLTGVARRKNRKWESELAPKGLVDIRLEFKAEFKININFGLGSFKRDRGVQATARAGFKAEASKDSDKRIRRDDSGVAIYMDVMFTGLVLYYLKSAKNGVVVHRPGKRFSYITQENDLAPDDKEDTGNIPDDQKRVILEPRRIESMSGYLQLL